jgi:uridine phosphorylase
MSIKDNRSEYEAAYARRSEQTFFIEPGSPAAAIRSWSKNVLIVASSPEYGEKIAGLFDEVVHRDSFLKWTRPGEPSESFAGRYKGTRVSVRHLGITPAATGASYMDMGLESFRGSPARNVVIIGELSSLQKNVKIGDLVAASSAVRADECLRSYADPDIPATANAEVSWALEKAAKARGYTIHSGVCWSCGAGAGIYDPFLAEEALKLADLGVLGSALEASTAYLLGSILGLRVGSLWLATDSVYEPITWKSPSPRLGWAGAWEKLARTALDALASFGEDEEKK